MKEIFAAIRGAVFALKCKMFKKNVYIKNGLKLYGKIKIKGTGNIVIGKNCSIWGIPGNRSQYVTLYTNSPDAVIRIGDNVNLFAAKFSCKYSIIIGNNVLIEDTSILDTDFHSIHQSRDEPLNESKEICEIIICDRVSIASRSIISKGAKIGEDTIVGPCSVVNRSFPSGSIIFGNPAKKCILT